VRLKYPVYIISYGRHESRQTARSFESLRVPYQIVVEPCEAELYAAVIEALFTQPVLGGLATEIRIVRLDMAVAERAKDHRLGFGLELAIHYHTRFGEPQQPA
jgi:hypothetical protein